MVLVLSPVISFKPTHRTKGRCYVTAKPLHFPSRYTGPTVADVGERAVTLAIQRMAPSSRNGDDAAVLANFKKRKAQYMAYDREGRDVFLADSGYVLQMAQQDFPEIKFHFTSEF